MDIHVLVINVGNSRLAMGTFVAGELQQVRRCSIKHPEDWPQAIAQAWAPLEGKSGAAVAGASVNPQVQDVVDQVVRNATGCAVQWVGRDLEVPVRNRTDLPEQTGVDRLLGVAAAYEQLQKACIVVDAGTAVTVNVCNDQGEFLGGAIAPGAAAQLQALHELTAKLPLVTLAAPSSPIGQTTEQAIRHGVYHGIRGLVKELAEHYATHLGRWPEIIATGGDATALFEGWELIHAIAPDLTLYGIALAYAEHHIRHES
ncbi:MAG: type III pantothenate kinase [Phycisphaerae bacterium]|nr:type III pantothenate kinase [Phycisphaerae bacterium]